MATPTKRLLRNQQKGRRQRQRLTHTHSASSQTNTTCTSIIDTSTLPFVATTPPLLLPVIPDSLPPAHADSAQPSVQSAPNVISPVHTGKRVKGYIRHPPTNKETTDNLDPSIFASLRATKDAYKSNLSEFERNHNVHRPPDDNIPTGHEIEHRSYRFHHGAFWTKDEEDVLYNAIKYVAEHPQQRKKSEKKLSFWKRVQIEMNSSRTSEALSSHFSNIINNKMKEQHPRFSDFIKLKQLIDNSKVAESDSSKKATLNRYTAMLDMKAKTKAERKRDKNAKQEQLDDNINAVCNLLKDEIGFTKQVSNMNDESDTHWRRRNIIEIRNGIDLIAANKENSVLAKEIDQLQISLLSKDHAESIIIEYERLKQKQLSTIQIMSKLIKLAKLMN